MYIDVCEDPTEDLKWGPQFKFIKKMTVKVVCAFQR